MNVTRHPVSPEPRLPDRERVVQLVRRYQDRLRSYLATLGCREANVDDLVQETFLEVLESGFDERSAGATAAYLRRIARNRFLKLLRARRRRPEVTDWDAIDAAWARFEGEDDTATYMRALEACLGTLSERSRAALEMRYRERVARAAIGKKIGLSEGGVQSLLIRARTRLRECIEGRISR